MAGIRHHPLADISDIRSLLDEQYQPSAIIKELVQNADDAHAARLFLAVHPGLPHGCHPLLRSPALLVLNDGVFRENDAHAIPYKGLGAKGNDRAAIGKFGRGLKSVFHLCEAFFYVASPQQPGMQSPDYDPILNPWENSGLHPEWEGVEQSCLVAEIQEAVDEWTHGLTNWFCLWIPLRTRAMLNGKTSIKDAYPRGEDFLDLHYARRIAVMFPFMRSLHTVGVWESARLSKWQQIYNVHRTRESTRSLFRLGELAPGKETAFSGSAVYTGNSEDCWEYRFYARERLADDERLRQIRKSDDWPRAPTFDLETGAPIMDPDKAEQHAAVVFGGMMDLVPGDVTLSTVSAVFLPLSGHEAGETRTDAMFHLLLHGYFFVDAGRRELVREETGNIENTVPADWNRALEERVQHGLILPTLREFVTASALNDAHVESLTCAMEATPLYQANRETLCAEYQWICQQSLMGACWSLVSTAEAYWELPALQSTTIRPWDILPGLRTFLERHCVVFSATPRLALREPQSWSPYLTDLLVNIPVREVFAQPSRLSYLVRFLEETGDATTCSESLLDIVRLAFARCTLEELRDNSEALRAFIQLLPAGQLIPLRADVLQSLGTEEALRHLAAIRTSALLLPREFVPEGMSTGRLSLQDGRKLLDWLERASIEPRSRSSAAVYFMNLMTGSHEEKRQVCGDIAVFLGRDFRQNTLVALSWNHLRDLRKAGCLVGRRLNLARPLQDALAEDTVIALLEDAREVSDALFGMDLPPICDEQFCFAFLSRRPALKSQSDQRISLFKALLQREDYPDYPRILRYLLHAKAVHFENVTDPLLSADMRRDDAFWGRVVHHILRHTDSGWRSIASELLEELTPRQRHALLVTTANSTIAEAALLKHGATSLSGCPLSRSERMALLDAIKDDALWTQLPYHETDSGTLVSLPGHAYTFLQSSIPVPESLKEDVVLLATPLPDALRDRYRRFNVREWSSSGVLQVALDKPNPDGYWRELMSAIGTLGKDLLTLVDIRDRLQKTAWLPGRTGVRKSVDILCLPAINTELDRLMALPELLGVFYTEDGLVPEFREHPAYSIVQQCLLPDTGESFAILTTCLDGVEAYYLGDLAELSETPGRWVDYLAAFDGATADFLPGLVLLRTIAREEAYRPYIPELMSILLKPLPVSTVLRTLEELRRVYTAEKGLFAYNINLSSLVRTAGGRSEILKGVALRNRTGHWKWASELCIELPGVHPSDTLEAGQAGILHSLVARVHSMQPGDEAAIVPGTVAPSTAARLKAYFTPWQGMVPREVIGGFLALWGDKPAAQELAQEFLGHRWKVATFREALHWTVLTGRISGAGEDVNEAMRRQRFLLSLHKEGQDRVLVTNLLGEPFHARITADVDTLFLGEFEEAPLPNHRGKRVCLRSFDPASHSRRRLVEILRDSARMLLEKTYCQSPDNLEALWNDLNDSEQVDLAVAQEMILDNAFFYFGLLDTSHQQWVRQLRRQWDNLRFDAFQESRVGGTRASHAVEEQKEALRANLRDLIEQDVAFQEEILLSVCGKVTQSQYETGSVPFELFQNADDAAVERTEMEPEAAGVERLVLQVEPGLLRWMHWGRAINACRSQKLSSAEGQERGYHLDLCKMLTLSASDKAGQETVVTGKFGLGFKSVFLLSKQPCVVSGDLGFSVVAGMYPRRLDPQHLTALRQRLQDFAGNDVRGGTIIELETRDGIAAETTLSTFVHTVHVLVAFARAIRRIDLVDQNGTEVIAWREHPIPDVKDAFTGELTPTRRSGLAPTRALLLRPKPPFEGALLIPMDAYGFVGFSDSFPTCWVTTPTRSGDKGLGIALNAPFQVDVGRVQLAETSQNLEVAQNFSGGLEQVLANLYNASIQWEQLGQALHLAADADPYRFWESLWNVATRSCLLGTGFEGIVVRQSLVHRGLASLWKELQTVPTGLSEQYRCLTAISKVRRVVVGVLDEDTRLFASIASWSSLSELCGVGEAVSGSRVATTVRRLGLTHAGRDLSLLTVLKEKHPGETGQVTPEDAQHLAPVITRERLDTMLREDRLRTEGEELAKWLQTRTFLSEAGTYRPGSEMLILSTHEADVTEEVLRSRFAPSDRLLSRQYAAETLALFRVCRDRMDAPAELLKEWGLHAVGREPRLAFLQYLLRGELSTRIMVTPAERDNSWLQDLETAGYRTYFRDEEWTQLLGKLGHSLLRHEEKRPDDETGDEAGQRVPLETVSQWWRDNGTEYLAAYEARLYPEGSQFLKAIRADYGATVEEREAWLGLLLRSSLETLGRSRHEQHRTFLRLAQEKQWIRILAEDPQGGDRFFQQVRAHVGGQLQFLDYFHWMKQFLGISVFAAWVDEYADAILSVNQMTGPVLPDHLFSPRINPLFQRGGPDAPPLQGVLGIGACFLLRELVRIGAVTNAAVHPYCFVPSRRVRQFMDYCGVSVPDISGMSRLDQAALIHEQIVSHLGESEATFALAFDIPFEVIAGNQRIWNDLLEVDYVDIPEEDEE